ncbi:ATP-binding cassette domain-containing protein [Haloparvum alkalitolerans]|uniref:ABC transporter ATP-binding protein n=1 Tax=Haloparvum alkalitolerans TaxID=1042953 RepID=UPI003CFA4EE0
MSDAEPLLRVDDLEKHFSVGEGLLGRGGESLHAVDGISFDVRRGETVGLIGESGCGKSTAAETLLRLREPTGGTVTFDGDRVGEYGDDELRAFRRRTGMIFQDPVGSFDPRLTVGESAAEFLRVHGVSDAATRRAVVTDLFERVGLSADHYERYPHELSGGQSQRAALARALVLNPDLLIADEPVSALDLSIQAAVLSLLDDLQAELELSVLLITHDVSVVREICDRVNVMYLGEIVESGPTEAVLRDPEHPYTEALIDSVPTPDPTAERETQPLSGEIPEATNPPSGCRFHTRCPVVIPPAEFDGDADAWRAAFDCKLTVADPDFGGEALADRVAEPTSAGVREAFDLPESVGDEDLDAALTAAVEALAAGNVEEAGDRLAAFESVCERVPPPDERVDEHHEAACHRVGE